MVYIIFLLYSLVLIVFTLVYFFIVYHLTRYSSKTKLNKIILSIFIPFSALLLFSNILLFFSINWTNLVSTIFS